MATSTSVMTLWDQVKDRLASKLPWEGYQSWIVSTAQQTLDGHHLTVRVPNQATKEWIESEYLTQIQAAVRDLGQPVMQVHFLVSSEMQPPGNGAAAIPMPSTASESYADNRFEPVPLNPRYTFSNFVVGTCNEFAHAAARAASDHPGVTYNPLFIYGGPGMGKTHLMHAIGQHLIKDSPNLRVICTTGERFMNQLVQSIRTDRMPQFHEYFRTADVLLVDDVHTLANRERTQEEFFHTFNELFDRQKQIVLSSDSPPKNTQGLVDRLRSRFEWGLMVDVQAPDLETKMAILEKKAAAEGLQVPEDVRVFIATKTRSNVRELEGSLLRLLAYSSVTGEPITLDMARQTLRHLGTGSERRVTIEAVIKAVAERFSLQPSQIKQKGNMRNISYPRQIAMYLAKELTSASLPEIGRAFNGKHHTTVLHSVNKIDGQRQSDPDLNRIIHSLIDSLN
jgi:chromosomal replication initiator protein